MKSIEVGRFRALLSGQCTIWIGLSIEDREVMSFSHKDISDLIYCLKRAKKECKKALGPDVVI